MEEEFIRNQEQMKPLEEKQEVQYSHASLSHLLSSSSVELWMSCSLCTGETLEAENRVLTISHLLLFVCFFLSHILIYVMKCSRRSVPRWMT